MQKLIKNIREYLGLSQADFAEKLGVTFATVNRWENGRAMPTGLAQNSLYELCRENKVPVYDMIIEKIKTAANKVQLEDGRILLYHGSKSGIKGDIAPIISQESETENPSISNSDIRSKRNAAKSGST